jgi:hypothetical protein
MLIKNKIKLLTRRKYFGSWFQWFLSIVAKLCFFGHEVAKYIMASICDRVSLFTSWQQKERGRS